MHTKEFLGGVKQLNGLRKYVMTKQLITQERLCKQLRKHYTFCSVPFLNWL